jgi:hypothetical protein
MSIDPFAKVKQEIYNKVKHHLTSSRETARLTTRTTTYKKNTPLNIISNGVVSLEVSFRDHGRDGRCLF